MNEKSMNPEREMEKLAKHTLLSLSKEELAKFSSELADMISFLGELGELENERIGQSAQQASLQRQEDRPLFREDRPAKNEEGGALLEMAPRKKDGYVTVPAVIGDGEEANG